MLFNTKKWTLAGLLLLSSSLSYAAPSTVSKANLTNVAGSTSNISAFSLSVDGVNINVSGWSDTKNSNDDKIQSAKDLNKYNSGWGIRNRNEGTGSPAHSTDNYGNDYDFFLFKFSEEVSLSQATYGWTYKNESETQVSVAALKSGNDSLSNKTWSGIKSSETKASDFAQIAGGLTNFTSTSVGGVFSTHWLIGALNAKFGGKQSDEGNDAFKLASVSFNKKSPTPPQAVPEPSSILLFGLAIMGFAASNRRKLK